MPVHTDCPKCGSAFIVSRLGDLETYRCSCCTWETWATANFCPPIEAPKPVVVEIHWKRNCVSPRETMAARNLVPEFNNLPVSKLVELFGNAPFYSLGIFDGIKAERLRTEGERLGLAVVIRPIKE